jgi:predicted ATPase
MGQYAAVKLFVQRAQAVRPDFALHASNAATIAEICHRLDGLPLAIELAAASVKVLPAHSILSRLAERFELPKSNLRDRPDRQQTLRASIGWSYDLLTEEEKAIFRRVSTFAGSFTLESAEAVCQSTGIDRRIVLDALAALTTKSLIRPLEFQPLSQRNDQNPRFTMLQTIREVGLHLLEETGELEAMRGAHAADYEQMAQEAGREIWGASVAEWVSHLDAENENLRATLDYYLAHPQGAEAALRLVGSLWRFWEIRGYVHEGRAWIDRALQRRAEVAPAGRWLALHAAGNLALDQGDYALATRHYRESLQLLLTLQPTLTDADQLKRTRYAIGNTLTNLGRTALFQSQIKEALAFTEQSLNIHRQILGEQSGTHNSQIGIAIPTTNMAMIKLHQSQYAQAATYSNDALAIYRELGDERGIGWNLHILGTVARDRGDYERAAQFYAETMAHFERLSNQADLPPLYLDMGELARLQDNARQAEAEFRRGMALAQALGNKKEMANSLTCLSVIARQRGDFAEASALGERGLTLHREIGDQFGLSDALHNRGWLALRERRLRAAAADFVESLRIKARLGERKGIVALLIALSELASMEPSTAARAARLLAAAESLRLEIGLAVPPVERAEAQARLATIRAKLSEGAFAAAYQEGQLMEMQQAIAYALMDEMQAEG